MATRPQADGNKQLLQVTMCKLQQRSLRRSKCVNYFNGVLHLLHTIQSEDVPRPDTSE